MKHKKKMFVILVGIITIAYQYYTVNTVRSVDDIPKKYQHTSWVISQMDGDPNEIYNCVPTVINMFTKFYTNETIDIDEYKKTYEFNKGYPLSSIFEELYKKGLEVDVHLSIYDVEEEKLSGDNIFILAINPSISSSGY